MLRAKGNGSEWSFSMAVRKGVNIVVQTHHLNTNGILAIFMLYPGQKISLYILLRMGEKGCGFLSFAQFL